MDLHVFGIMDFSEGDRTVGNAYVDIQKSVDEIVEDLQELARINPRRPYFLPVHVRENNDVDRKKMS